MSQNLDDLLRQMDSPELKDRKLALAALRDMAPDFALPVIKKGLQDSNQQVRSMAIFALGLKKTDETLEILLDLLRNEPDYGVRADAAGAIGLPRRYSST